MEEKLERIEALLSSLANRSQIFDKEYLTVKEAAKFIGRSESVIYKLTHFNIIPFSKPQNGNNYIKKSDLENWMASNPIKSKDQIMKDVSRKSGFKKV